MTTPDRAVRISTFNPYECRFPGRRVLSREALHVAKVLRAQGYAVTIGDDDTEINLLTEKGFAEIASNPLVLTLLEVPLEIIAVLIAQHFIDRRKAGALTSSTNVLLKMTKDGNEITYSQDGSTVAPEVVRDMLDAMRAQQEAYRRATLTPAPTQERPVPLLLEHTGQVVGWCRISVRPEGLHVDEGVIDDGETRRRVENGELRGFSIAGLARRATCSICGESYFECDHLSGYEYSGTMCRVTMNKMDLAEISIVADPINEKTLIQFLRRTKDDHERH
jgi:hypothetical protein